MIHGFSSYCCQLLGNIDIQSVLWVATQAAMVFLSEPHLYRNEICITYISANNICDLICENQPLPANSSLEKISSKVGVYSHIADRLL